ncbi:hypothetical protein GH714_043186 [Hevea brasiliensis]|uniref:Uncharacterized protein n=1 Tax=Hevea brasiliensis TaxID=3981 RepID=A0A6A6K2M6_HEVBR|nr:hypothetical protein GH714_043186 [Hevea brasiliensis]
MGDLESQVVDGKMAVVDVEEQEKDRLVEGMTILDFDVLCSTVALQTQGKWKKLETADFDANAAIGGEFGGVFRIFGKNMRRAGFGSCFLQGTVYYILALSALLNFIAFIITKRRCFLYLAVAFIISIGMYLSFFRTQMRKKFNIRGSDISLDDCIYIFSAPAESRTLEMNNVQDGTWHGRGDTICIGSYSEGNKAIYELHPPSVVSTNSSDIGDHLTLGSLDFWIP